MNALLEGRWIERVEVPEQKCFDLLSGGFGRLGIGRGGGEGVLFLDLVESEGRSAMSLWIC